MKRRAFIQKTVAAGSFAAIPTLALSDHVDPKTDGEQLTLNNPGNQNYFEPLEEITIKTGNLKGKFKVYDAGGRIYHEGEVMPELKLKAGGKLGSQSIEVIDKKGRILDRAFFHVNTCTRIQDENQEFEKLLATLYWTMRKNQGAAHRLKGKIYYLLMGWFQDHVHVMKGMKYFYPELKSGINLFADGQREDGMIFDNYYQSRDNMPFWSWRFNYDNFVIDPGEDSSSFFVRIPIENMGEFTFLEGVYFTWKATGDDAWMERRIDNALKAIEYSTTNPWRWSKKFQLMKRAYTIDIWDFLPDEEAARFQHDVMAGNLDKTSFGVLYADNIGLAVGCDYVAEMLTHLGRKEEAEKIQKLGNELRDRTNKLCWNGSFYTHRIPEDPNENVDFGDTDESAQVTLSNSYVLNKRISHEHAVEIIKTYQRIRKEMPETSPGEWYMCYPPYEKGWHMEQWEYMNGGVSGITAGELAHGAFEHGFETYGADILRRVYQMAQTTDNYLECIYRGAMPELPERELTPLDISKVANADFSAKGAEGVPGWMGGPIGNDIADFPTGKQEYEHIPFDIINPAKNGRKACMGLSGANYYQKSVALPINRKLGAIYLLHNYSGGNYAGKLTWNYADGSDSTYYVLPDQDLLGFSFPKPKKKEGWPVENRYIYKVAWTGKNHRDQPVGVYICGLDNPHPEREVKSLTFAGPDTNHKWMISGITLSDKPHFFMPPHVSYGAPDAWAAAAVTYALIEGLVGVKDKGVAFDKALIAPRWNAAGVKQAKSHIKYEASGGYVAYDYQKNDKQITLDFTSNAADSTVEILLDAKERVKQVKLNSEVVPFENKEVEGSRYLVVEVKEVGVYGLEVELA